MTLATGQNNQAERRPATLRAKRIRPAPGSDPAARVAGRPAGFTLIELILVLALLVVITSLVAPAMSKFIRGRALDSEARRLAALVHAGQSRAVSEGLPVDLWVDPKQGAYGLQAETPSKAGDPKAENLKLDENLQISVLTAASTTMTTFHNLPAVRFLPDGTIDENSPQVLRLTDSQGHALWLVQSSNRMGYEISDTDKSR